MIIVKKGFLKISVWGKCPLESSYESMDKHSVWDSSKFTKHAFFYYLTYSFAPWRLLYNGFKTWDFPLTGWVWKLWKFIFDFNAKGKITK